MARRLSSPVFIGRSSELRTLLSAADAAASGQPWGALIGGEAGVGKTRLVEEVSARLRERGWLVLEGGSVALGDDSLPFGPIVQALRALVRQLDPDRIAAAAGPSLPELARLLPELSGIAGDAVVPATAGEWLQGRIFGGILRLLGGLGQTAPILLVIEDLQWSDRSTRDMLAFLARNVREERLLVIGTFRTDELPLSHPMTAWLAEAERQLRVEHIELARFEREELVELLTSIAGATPPRALVDSIARRSDGNAFFAEELAAAVDESGEQRERLPETLRGVLLVRMSVLSDAARRLVEVAAVAGRQVEHEVLGDVCGLSEVELRSALHEVVDAQILVVAHDGTAGRYRFRHALAQEAAYDELLPSERRSLHAAFARAIEARPAGGGAAAVSRLVELAHHWAAAHDPNRAFKAAIEAGDASRAVFAYADAARQYERAIELWDVVAPEDRPGDRDLADMFDAASAAAMVVGDASRAVNLARQAIELVDASAAPGGDLGRRARARERFGLASWLAGDTATSIRLLEDAVELLDGMPPSTDQARVLAGLAANLMLAGRSAESVPFAERAIATARATADQGIESRAMNILGVDLATLGNIAGGIDLLRRSLASASPADDPTAVPRAYANLGSVLEMGSFVEEALEVFLAGAEGIRQFGSELGFRTHLEVNAAAMLIELGRYPEAAALIERHVDRVLPGVSTNHLHVTRAHLGVRLGDLPAARRDLEIARSEAGGIADAQFVIDLYAFGTEISLWEGDPAVALAMAREGFARLAAMDAAVILGQLAIPAARAAADLAVKARAARDAAGAAAAIEAGADLIGRYRAASARLAEPDDLATHEIGWRMALCAAELGRAAGDDDPARWNEVRPALTARPAPYLEAYVLWREADALAARGAVNAATKPLTAAHTIALAIGARLLVAGIEGLGRRVRIDLGPAPTPPPAVAEPSVPRPGDSFGLTGREREVLLLVAEGYTNRRIAETLFISESTAGVHVSNILGKLGVSSRTEAATIAVRLGMDRVDAV